MRSQAATWLIVNQVSSLYPILALFPSLPPRPSFAHSEEPFLQPPSLPRRKLALYFLPTVPRKSVMYAGARKYVEEESVIFNLVNQLL